MYKCLYLRWEKFYYNKLPLNKIISIYVIDDRQNFRNISYFLICCKIATITKPDENIRNANNIRLAEKVLSSVDHGEAFTLEDNAGSYGRTKFDIRRGHRIVRIKLSE